MLSNALFIQLVISPAHVRARASAKARARARVSGRAKGRVGGRVVVGLGLGLVVGLGLGLVVGLGLGARVGACLRRICARVAEAGVQVLLVLIDLVGVMARVRAGATVRVRV